MSERRMAPPIYVSLLILFCTFTGSGVLADDFISGVQEATSRLAEHESRVPGTTGHDAAIDEIIGILKTIGGTKTWVDSFPVVVPVYEENRLVIREGDLAGNHTVYPLWPSLSQLNLTPKDGFDGDFVYVGSGSPGEIPPQSVRGQIAVMEFSGGKNWVTVASYNPAAILLLGSADETILHAHEHILYMPVQMPRFYVPEGLLAKELRAGNVSTGTLSVRGEWREVAARNIYTLVPAREGTPPAKAFVIGVVGDAMSMVPGHCPGADAAVDVGLAMELVKEFSQNPPARPVLFTFLDAWGIYHLGTREMFSTLCVSPEAKEDLLAELDNKLNEYRGISEKVERLAAEQDVFAALADDEFSDIQRYVRDAANFRTTLIDTDLEPARMDLFMADESEKEAMQRRVQDLSQQRMELLSTLRQMTTTQNVSSDNESLARELWQETRTRIADQLAEAQVAKDRETEKLALRRDLIEALELPGDTENPLGFFLGIDLSDAGLSCGATFQGMILRMTEIPNTIEFRDWLRRIEESEGDELWPGEMRRAVNLRPVTTAEDFQSYMLGNQASLSAPGMSFGTPGVTWTTLSGYRLRVDTGRDLYEHLDWEVLEPQIAATRALVRRLCNQTDFACPEPNQLPRWRRITGTIVDQAPGEPLPRLPMKDYLTTLVVGDAAIGRANAQFWWGDAAGMRRQQFVFSGTDGEFAVDYFPGHIFSAMARHFAQAYKFDDDGQIVRAVDIMQSGKGVNLNYDVMARNPTPVRAKVFTCENFTGYGFIDPRFLMPLASASILDARRDSEPGRMNFTFNRGVMSLQLEPKTRFNLIASTGIDNRIMLLNTPEDYLGLAARRAAQGIPVDGALTRQTWHQSAVDFYRLNGLRLENYRKAGIVSEPVDRLRASSKSLLEDADLAIGKDDAPRFFRNVSAALANEVRAYRAVRDTANDVVRGAIFLLLMLVPFAYAMERLLFASPHVYRQLFASSVIFLLMAAILWGFHPAFRISAQPMTIILAFVIILMSLMVMSMVFSRFERELEEMRSGRAESSGAESSKWGLVSTAIKLGIANMRKRKLRTVLTGATVVLITFTLLCFSSTSSYQGQKDNRINGASPYTGLLVRQPSIRALQREVLDYVGTVVDDRYSMATRAWRFSPWDPNWRMHVQNPANGRQASLPAALALSPEESLFTAVSEILPDWERFTDHSGCYLSRRTAQELDAKPGDRVVILGTELELLGVYDGPSFNEKVLDIDGETIAPLDYHAVGRQQRQKLASGDWSMEVLSSEIQSGEGLEPLRHVPHLDASSIAIVPVNMISGGLGNETFSLRSIAIKTETRDQAKEVAGELVDRLAVPVYYGAPEGVNVVASTPLIPKPPKSLFIPLLIAGLIIFNTMLSSIAERKKEIYTYTSLGLAPMHIATLFLAEAATYGLMGSVFGYVVGQWVATGLSQLGWLGSITLNYSGTQAVTTMSVVIIVIMISSLVPAFMAGKLAAPSNRISWQVPEPEDGVIRDTLPFTATQQTAPGMIAFLKEYFEAHKAGAIGSFTTNEVGTDVAADPRGAPVYTLRGMVWLAPYDLGVYQDVSLKICPAGEEDIYEIHIELIRGSGQPSSWWRLNRVFLNDLRRQLLGWRNLKPDRMIAYIEDRGE